MQSKENSRIVEEYSEYIFDADGIPLKAKVASYYQLDNGENIVPI